MTDNEPLLTVTDKEGVLIHVGNPESFSVFAIANYAKDGCTIKTITIDEFRSRDMKLYQVNPEFLNQKK